MQEDDLHRATTDLSMLRTRVDTAREQTRSEEQHKIIAQEKVRQLELKNKKLSDQLAKSKDATRLLQVEKTRLATQYEHAARKQEKDCQKLKERLQKLVAEKNSEKKLGMRLLNSLQRQDGSRGTWGNRGKADDEMHHVIVASYEDKQKELALENKELRMSLVSLERDLVAVLNRQSSQGEAPAVEVHSNGYAARAAQVPVLKAAAVGGAAAGDVPSSPHDKFALPYDLARGVIEDSLKTKMEEVKEVVASLEAAASSGVAAPEQDQATIDKLQRQLDECARIIDQQQMALLDAPASPDKSFLSESILVDRAQDLDRERAELAAKSATFEAERSALTQLAINHDVSRLKALEAIRTPAKSAPAPQPPVPAPAPESRPLPDPGVDLSRYLQFG